METKKDKKEGLLNERMFNSMTTTKNDNVTYFRPNNYRRQIEVKEKTNSTLEKAQKYYSTSTSYGTLNINPHTKLISIRNYKPNITIQYGRNTLTALYSQNITDGVKNVFEFRGTIEERQAKLEAKKEEIKERLDKALYKFARELDIWVPFKQPIWTRHEDFIKGESFIDSIPYSCIVHDTHFKKVYEEGIEFMGGKGETPVVKLKNYIKNRAIEDIAPDIAQELNLLHQQQKVIIESNVLFAENLKSHLEVLGEINKAIKKLNNRLDQKKLNDYF